MMSTHIANSNWQSIGTVDECRKKLHREPFRISHGLADSSLFDVERLLQAASAAKHRPGDVYFDAGKVAIDDKWGQIPVPDMPVEEVIRRVETAGAWIILKHAERDPAYAAVLEQFREFVHSIAGSEGAKQILNPEMLIIISSPDRLTPFHFDAEINFLVQVRGEKEVWICDPADRTVVTEADIEAYYSGQQTAGKYSEHVQDQATRFKLNPGDGVHIPSHAAHWVRNGNGVSISLSLNFEFPRWKYRDAYRLNHALRKFRISPSPPGRSIVIDQSKSLAFRVAQSTAKLIRL